MENNENQDESCKKEIGALKETETQYEEKKRMLRKLEMDKVIGITLVSVGGLILATINQSVFPEPNWVIGFIKSAGPTYALYRSIRHTFESLNRYRYVKGANDFLSDPTFNELFSNPIKTFQRSTHLGLAISFANLASFAIAQGFIDLPK